MEALTGVVLAGGRGRRMEGLGPKPGVQLAGRALIEWPLVALGGVCGRVAVVCKAATPLPALPAGVERWEEPDEPRHPLAGILHALRCADGPVLVCGADMPFVGQGELGELLSVAGGSPGAAAVVAETARGLEPALAVYRPVAVRRLGGAGADVRLRQAVAGLNPVRVALAPDVVRSINTPEELAVAQAELGA